MCYITEANSRRLSFVSLFCPFSTRPAGGMTGVEFVFLDRCTPLVVVAVGMLVYQPSPLSSQLLVGSVIRKRPATEEEENKTRTGKEPHWTLYIMERR